MKFRFRYNIPLRTEVPKDLEKCCFCLEEMTEAKVSRCNHKFHANCVERWFQMGHSECPVCRTDLTPGFEFIVIQHILSKEGSQVLEGVMFYQDTFSTGFYNFSRMYEWPLKFMTFINVYTGFAPNIFDFNTIIDESAETNNFWEDLGKNVLFLATPLIFYLPYEYLNFTVTNGFEPLYWFDIDIHMKVATIMITTPIVVAQSSVAFKE